MQISLSQSLKFRVINFIEKTPSGLHYTFISFVIFSLSVLIAIPFSTIKELLFGTSDRKVNQKSSLRAVLWLWNRSWVPLKPKLQTFFNIGSFLSVESCRKLSNDRFISKDSLKKECDLAQLEMSEVKTFLLKGNNSELEKADKKVTSRLTRIFNEAYHWAISQEKSDIELEEASSKPNIQTHPFSKDFNNESTSRALLDLDDLFSRIGQEYFLVSGTFLGLIRNGGFIGHDHDIDVGIFEHKLKNQLFSSLNDSANFVVTKTDNIFIRRENMGKVSHSRMKTPAVIKLTHKSGIGIDIFIHFYDGESVWHGSSIQRWNNKKFKLRLYPFLGRNFAGAEDFELYLSENYGEDWRLPNPDFNVNFDTPNLCFVGSLDSLVYYSWMVVNAVEQRNCERVKSYLDMLSNAGVLQLNNGVLTIK